MSERPSDNIIRPTSLDDVIGQADVVAALRVALDGAKARGELPGHILFGGPAGTGKTTLALCVANAIGGNLYTLIGPSLRSVADISEPMLRVEPNDAVFIDEIHRMWRPAQEFLFPIMEDGKMTFGNSGKGITMPPMVVIAATTEPERLLTPMLDRFALVLRLKLYAPTELRLIADRAAGKWGCGLDAEASKMIAEAASGVPRVAIRLVRAARDYAYTDQHPRITVKHTTPITTGNAADKIAREVNYWADGGKVTIRPEDVRKVLTSTAYEWRVEGRKAG